MLDITTCTPGINVLSCYVRVKCSFIFYDNVCLILKCSLLYVLDIRVHAFKQNLVRYYIFVCYTYMFNVCRYELGYWICVLSRHLSIFLISVYHELLLHCLNSEYNLSQFCMNVHVYIFSYRCKQISFICTD